MKLKTTIILSMMMILLVIPTLASATYCDNQTNVIFCEDAENGNITTRGWFAIDGASNIKTINGSKFATNIKFEGNKSLYHNATKDDTLLHNFTPINISTTPINISFKYYPQNLSSWFDFSAGGYVSLFSNDLPPSNDVSCYPLKEEVIQGWNSIQIIILNDTEITGNINGDPISGGCSMNFNDPSRVFQRIALKSSNVFEDGYYDNLIIQNYTSPITPTPPTITSFTTNNSTILNGTSTQINWITGNATNLDLSSINVSGLTAYNVSPTINTTYTLTATNENGSVNANLTINVYYPPPCIPSYYCSQTGTCNASNTIPCLNVSDLNTCGIPYNPLNYSDYNQACNYTTTGYVASYEASDAPKALFDFVVAIFVGMAGVAVLIGLGIALGIFTKSDTGKNLLKNLKR